MFFCTQALYCFVYSLGWPLVISWRIGFSGKGFLFLNIVTLRAKPHFPKLTLQESHLHIADSDYGVASFVIGHGILAGTYLAEYPDSLK